MESMTAGGAKSKTKGALEGVKDDGSTGNDDDDDDSRSSRQLAPQRPRRARVLLRSRSRSAEEQLVQEPADVYVYGVMSRPPTATAVGRRASRAEVRDRRARRPRRAGQRPPGRPLPAAREMRAHWRVLEEASRGATVLPVRFGTVIAGERRSASACSSRTPSGSAELLDELHGRVQLTVKGDYHEDGCCARWCERSPHVAALRERRQPGFRGGGYYDRIRLGELVAGEVAPPRAGRRAACRGWSRSRSTRAPRSNPARRTRPSTSRSSSSGEQVDAFSGAVRRSRGARRADSTLRYVGPLPPYSFAEADSSAEAAAWA